MKRYRLVTTHWRPLDGDPPQFVTTPVESQASLGDDFPIARELVRLLERHGAENEIAIVWASGPVYLTDEQADRLS